MRRRSLLAAGPAVAARALLLPATPVSLLSTTASAQSNSGPLSAIIELGGATYKYSENAGSDLGDYVDPYNRFVQRCIRVTNDQLPALTLFFRPDRTSSRAEVVFELGLLHSKTPPANLDGYRVTITRGDTTVFTAKVPRHFWFSRWRWQSAPRPITTNVADLIRSGLLPPYDDKVNLGTASAGRPQSYEIMGLAGIFPGMPSGGERDEIGPVTETQAEFICTGRHAALSKLLAQAEAAGTLPWHFRDEQTGAPLDKVRYPHANLYAPQTGEPYIAMAKTGMVLDSAHQPALAYLPYLLTGDPYYLETLQFQTTFNALEGPGSQPFGIGVGQVRAHAWNLRTLAGAAKVTPDATPRWLLPRRYFAGFLTAQHDWLTETFVKSSDPLRMVFRTTTQRFGGINDGPLEHDTYFSPWQEEFHAFIFGWVTLMGHPGWESIFRWKIGSTTARTDGKSGWGRVRPTPYHVALRENANAPWFRSWAEAWQMYTAHQPVTAADPDRLALPNRDLSYISYSRGALAMAVRLGVTQARPCFDWLDSEVRRLLQARQGSLSYKWSISAGA